MAPFLFNNFMSELAQIRPLQPHDQNLIWEFLRLAAHENSLQTVRSEPLLTRYAKDWGRNGDFGFLAHHESESVKNEFVKSELVGAVWARNFPDSEPGYGFISTEIPEISLAVREDSRGRGIGRALLKMLVLEAPLRCKSLSLSVRDDNIAALRLYKSAGFQRIDGRDATNCASGTSFVMRLDFWD